MNLLWLTANRTAVSIERSTIAPWAIASGPAGILRDAQRPMLHLPSIRSVFRWPDRDGLSLESFLGYRYGLSWRAWRSLAPAAAEIDG